MVEGCCSDSFLETKKTPGTAAGWKRDDDELLEVVEADWKLDQKAVKRLPLSRKSFVAGKLVITKSITVVDSCRCSVE